MREKRDLLSSSEIDKASVLIAQKVIDLINWNSIGSIHCYEEITRLKEISTQDIIRYAHLRFPQIEIKKPYECDMQQFDLILVPTLAFDLKCNRLGFGKGYYDRFLANQKRGLFVGLAYDWSLVESQLPATVHDVSLDYIVTEANIYTNEKDYAQKFRRR